jgi:thymidylate synthase
MDQIGVERNSRNGPVKFGGAVTTVYTSPFEKVIFWEERDANPFFHLYESLWMLQGRRDVAPLIRYVKRSIEYSDNGVTLHGAYGHRWRHMRRNGEGIIAFFKDTDGFDQLATIAHMLRHNADDRRAVLQMWDADRDLGFAGRDFPCNTMATFQRGIEGELNLCVFNRSNDIIWGAYGANAVQFGTLLEYMARWIGCDVGTYSQISVNWHAYLSTLEQVKNIRPDRANFVDNPYDNGKVYHVPMPTDILQIDEIINVVVHEADNDFEKGLTGSEITHPWMALIYSVLKAHHVYKDIRYGNDRYVRALDILNEAGADHADWVVAAREWIERRKVKHENQLKG